MIGDNEFEIRLLRRAIAAEAELADLKAHLEPDEEGRIKVGKVWPRYKQLCEIKVSYRARPITATYFGDDGMGDWYDIPQETAWNVEEGITHWRPKPTEKIV